MLPERAVRNPCSGPKAQKIFLPELYTPRKNGCGKIFAKLLANEMNHRSLPCAPRDNIAYAHHNGNRRKVTTHPAMVIGPIAAENNQTKYPAKNQQKAF